MKTVENHVQLIGNIGQDATMKNFENGNKLTMVSLATNDGYKNKEGEWVARTQWHRLIAWGPTAERLEKFFKKGRKVAVTGKITYRNYEDKDGNQREISQIVVDNFSLLNKLEEA